MNSNESNKFWEKLLCKFQKKYGKSALTTYFFARTRHNITANSCVLLMKAQLKELGNYYPGGFECAKFRGADCLDALK